VARHELLHCVPSDDSNSGLTIKVPGFKILAAALHRGSISSSLDSIERRQRSRQEQTNGGHQTRRKHLSRRHAQEARSGGPRHFSIIQCHGATALQPELSPPSQSIIPSHPARRAETPWGQHPAPPASLAVFGTRVVPSAFLQRLGGMSLVSIWEPSNLDQPSSLEGSNSLLETKSRSWPGES